MSPAPAWSTPSGLLPGVETRIPVSRYQFLMLTALLYSGSWTWSGTPETNPRGWDLVKTGAIPDSAAVRRSQARGASTYFGTPGTGASEYFTK